MDLLTTPQRPARHRPRRRARRVRRPALDRLSDEQLFDVAARVVSVPKQEPADSFILHAPLELLARRALLRSVRPRSARSGARTDDLGGRDLRTRGRADRSRVGRRLRVARGRRGRARRRDHAARTSTPPIGPRRGSATMRPTDAVMTLADPLLDSLAAAGHGEHLLLAARAHRGAAAARRSGCSDRSPARSPGSPSSASSGFATDWRTRGAGGTADTTRSRRRSRTRRGSASPAATSSFRPCTRSTTAASPATSSRRTFPPTSPRRARRSCGSPRRRCSRTTRRSRRTAGRTASRCRRRCSASGRGCPTATAGHRDRGDLRRRVPRRGRRARHRPRVATRPDSRSGSTMRSTPDPGTAASAVFHAGDDELEAVVPELRRARGQPRRRAPREVHAACLAAAAAPTRRERRLYLARRRVPRRRLVVGTATASG